MDRITPTDLTNLAVDRGTAPMNVGAVLLLDAAEAATPPSAHDVHALIASRLPRVPRLRQRLLRAPVGLGRPYWVEDARFDVDHHLQRVRLDSRGPGSERDQVLAVAADLVCRRLPLDRPLWAAVWVEGLSGGRAALVMVIHHVLADGLGGLAVLSALADGGPPPGAGPTAVGPGPSPRSGRRPTRLELTADVVRDRLDAVRQIPAGLTRLTRGLRELGLTTGRPRRAPATSLNRPTGHGRRLTTVTASLDAVIALAHARGCTVNDVVLTAVVGGLAQVLAERGEHPEALVVSVPVSSRGAATHTQLGNAAGVIPVRLPTAEDPGARLTAVSRITAARRSSIRGTSAAPLGAAFRTLARLRLLQPFIDRQRLVTTFVTNVRGPSTPLRLGGRQVAEVVPVPVNPGNVGVSFAVLSYAGRLGVTVVADPHVVPEQDRLTAYLAQELAALVPR